MLKAIRRAALACAVFAAGAGPLAADEDLAPPDTGTSDNFLGGLFGGSKSKKADGKFIDSLERARKQRPPFNDPDRSGLQIALREGLGGDTVPIPLPVLQTYAQGIVEKLLSASGITGIAPNVIVVAKDWVHGDAFPDGTIFITLGAIRNFESQHELAALLAHEVSHIILNHHDSDWFMSSQEQGLAAFELGLEAKARFEQQFGMQNRGSAVDRMKMEFIAEAVVFSSDVFLDSAFTREQEDEADLLGVDLLVAAGYSPSGISELLQDVEEQEAKHLEQAKAAEEARDRELQKKVETEGIASALSSMLKSVGEVAKSSLKDTFGKRHRAAEERLESILDYVDREYKDAESDVSPSDQWTAMRTDPSVVAALEAYRLTLEAREAIGASNYKDAADRIASAIAMLPPQHPLPRIVAAELAAAAGADSLAETFYREATKGEDVPLSAFVGLAELLRRDRQYEASAATLTRASKQLKDAPQLLPDWIAHADGLADVSTRSTQQLAVENYMTRCKLEPLKDLHKQCDRARAGDWRRLGTIDPRAAMVLAKTGLADALSAAGREMIQIDRPKVNARSGPGTGHARVGTFTQGTVLKVIGSEADWIKVQDRSGAESWIAKRLTRPASQHEVAAFLRAAAHSAANEVEPGSAARPGGVHEQGEATRRTPRDDDIATRLRKLDQLKAHGLITDGEYQTKRAEILKSL